MWQNARVGLIALLLGSITAAAQVPPETRGAWRIVPDREDFALRAQATGAPDTTLSLHCRAEQRAYVLELKSPALSSRPRGEDIRIAYKVDAVEQTFFNVTVGPDGTVPITTVAHQTAFWIIQSAMVRTGARSVAFSAGDNTWQFALEGYAELNDALYTRCKFEPRS